MVLYFRFKTLEVVLPKKVKLLQSVHNLERVSVWTDFRRLREYNSDERDKKSKLPLLKTLYRLPDLNGNP